MLRAYKPIKLPRKTSSYKCRASTRSNLTNPGMKGEGPTDPGLGHRTAHNQCSCLVGIGNSDPEWAKAHAAAEGWSATCACECMYVCMSVLRIYMYE